MKSSMRGTASAIAAVSLSAALVGGATEGSAQSARLEIHAGRVLDARGGSPAGLTVAPSVDWVGRASAAGLAGQATRFAGGGVLAAGGGWGSAAAAAGGPLALGVEGDGWLTWSSVGPRETTGSVRPRATLALGGWAVDAGPRVAVASDRSAGATPVPSSGGLLTRGETVTPGRTRVERAWEAGATMTEGPLRARAGWRTAALEEERWSEWTMDAALAAGPVLLGARVGTRLGEARERWGSARVAAELGSGAALIAQAGSGPSNRLTGRPGGSYGSVGLSVAVGAPRGPSARVRAPVRAGRTSRVLLRAAPGKQVELYADWNGWKAQRLEESAPGRYPVEVRLEPGLYRFALKVDGEWRVPEGFAAEEDGFGGKRALLRVVD